MRVQLSLMDIKIGVCLLLFMKICVYVIWTNRMNVWFSFVVGICLWLFNINLKLLWNWNKLFMKDFFCHVHDNVFIIFCCNDMHMQSGDCIHYHDMHMQFCVVSWWRVKLCVMLIIYRSYRYKSIIASSLSNICD